MRRGGIIFARTLVLLFAVLRYSIWYVTGVIGRLLGLGKDKPFSLRARLLRNMFESLGPLYVKLGQILSTRPDIVSRDIVAALKTLRQNAAPRYDMNVRQILERELGPEQLSAFSQLDHRPSFAASISQVYRGTLADGTEVAVKILKPSVDRVLQADAAIIRFWARPLRWLPMFRSVPVMEAIASFEQMLLAQTDFSNERRNAALFEQQFRRNRHLRFPVYVDDLCTRTVLVMHFERDLVPMDALVPRIAETRTLVTRALHVLFKMIFVTGHVHADLHAGNIFYDPDGTIVILDMGLVAVLKDEDRVRFADFFIGMAMGISEKCSDVVIETATRLPDVFDEKALRAGMSTVVSKHHGRVAGDYEILEFVSDIFDLQRRHGVIGTTKFMTTILSLLVFEGLIKTLVPDYNFQREASLFIASVKLTTPHQKSRSLEE